LEELKQRLAHLVNELHCCKKEIWREAHYKVYNPNKKKFLSIVDIDYSKLVFKIDPNDSLEEEILTIDNHVSPENVYSHMDNKYTPVINLILTSYMEFIRKYVEDVKKAKVPFYELRPRIRSLDNQLPKTCGAIVFNDCHMLVGTRKFANITLIIDKLYADTKDDPNYPDNLKVYLANMSKEVKHQLETLNCIKTSMELHNKDLTYKCIYKENTYGNIKITDPATCPPKTKKVDDCKPPCVYDKTKKGCMICSKYNMEQKKCIAK
jgi:hypothetical protein